MTADSTTPGGLGTFGFDDEGVPGRARSRSSREGVLRGFLTSRETAAQIGAAPAARCARTAGAGCRSCA